MDYETEEQQLEAIKKWWKENSSMIVSGVVIGVAAIFGWQSYQSNAVVHAEQASVLYEQVISASQNPTADINKQLAVVNQLAAEYTDTPYASLSALILAKMQLAAGDFVKAQQQYNWVVENTQQNELKFLAKIRLSRLLLSNNQMDKALILLSEDYPDSFKAMVLELKGDVLLIQGNKMLAKVAYTQALTLSNGSSRWLQLKIDDIGEVDIINKNKEVTEPSA